MDYKFSSETDQLRWGITASAEGGCWGARGAHPALALHQVHANLFCTVICRVMARVFMLPVDDGKSIYMTYFKHLTVALIVSLWQNCIKQAVLQQV